MDRIRPYTPFSTTPPLSYDLIKIQFLFGYWQPISCSKISNLLNVLNICDVVKIFFCYSNMHDFTVAKKYHFMTVDLHK